MNSSAQAFAERPGEQAQEQHWLAGPGEGCLQRPARPGGPPPCPSSGLPWESQRPRALGLPSCGHLPGWRVCVCTACSRVRVLSRLCSGVLSTFMLMLFSILVSFVQIFYSFMSLELLVFPLLCHRSIQ